MTSFCILSAQADVTWYHLIPLAMVISLVYNASRYEHPDRILRRAASWFVSIVVLMAAVFIVLYLLSFNL